MEKSNRQSRKKPGAVAGICVSRETPLSEILARQNSAPATGIPAGIALVVDAGGRLTGTITDGDVRRALLRSRSTDLRAADIMNRDPIAFSELLSYREIVEGLGAELERRKRRSRLFLGKIVLVDSRRRPVRILDYHELWEQRVAMHRRVAVIGMGYVGLTLALVLAKRGFSVTGVDNDASLVSGLKAGRSHVHEAGLDELLSERLPSGLRFSTDLPESDVFILAVGTPVTAHRAGRLPELDTGPLEAASRAVGARLRRGNLVVLRSTVPIGSTRRFVIPFLESGSGLRAGADFHVAFAPERTIEGNAIRELSALPQVIGGLNDDSTEAAAALFRDIAPNIIRVASLETSEMVKLVNNCFRDLIFAFSNEMVKVAQPFGVDIGEVILAANQGYPRDPVPRPSPGVGGPCLTKDPYILASSIGRSRPGALLSLAARGVNESMPRFVAQSVVAELRRLGKDPARCAVLLCGLAFKGRPETTDTRGSPALVVAQQLRKTAKALYGHDPALGRARIRQLGLRPVELPRGFRGMDAVLFLNDHPDYDKLDVYAMARALKGPAVVYDGWRVFRPDDVLAACPVVYMNLSVRKSSVGRKR